MAFEWPRGRATRRDYRLVFATEAGHRVLADLYRRTMLQPITADPSHAIFIQGMQTVFRLVARRLRLPPEDLARAAAYDDDRAFVTHTGEEND